MKPKEIPLEEGQFYHIYNRGNNRERLFYSAENYRFFLRRYDEYLADYLETYAFCLLPNHFHLLVRVKEAGAVMKAAERDSTFNLTAAYKGGTSISAASVSNQFRKLFTSYSMAINKQERRVGSLFQKNFKRIKVEDMDYLKNLVYYIHSNPQNHGIIDDFRQYPWSSYNGIIAGKPTKLQKDSVMDWFGGKEDYITFHINKADFNGLVILED